MIMKLSNKNERLVLENQKLVHYLVQKLGITQTFPDYEDFVSMGTIGLIKAAITFDVSKNINFLTYASKCINNEFFMHFRKSNKYVNTISFSEPIGDDREGKELTVEDTIEDPDSNFVEKILIKEDFLHLISIVLNYLEKKDRIIMLYRMGNVSQTDVADILHVSQSCIAKIEAKAILKIRNIARQDYHYKEVFSIAISGDVYRISFTSKDVSNFNKILSTLLQNITSNKIPDDFNIEYNQERIIIQLPAYPESLSFIADIIQDIDAKSTIKRSRFVYCNHQ